MDRKPLVMSAKVASVYSLLRARSKRPNFARRERRDQAAQLDELVHVVRLAKILRELDICRGGVVF